MHVPWIVHYICIYLLVFIVYTTRVYIYMYITVSLWFHPVQIFIYGPIECSCHLIKYVNLSNCNESLYSVYHDLYPPMCIYSQPQCVPVTSSTCAAVFPQSYYIPVANREENDTLSIVTEISDQLDLFCSNALLIFACLFIHPPCDTDEGTGLTNKGTFLWCIVWPHTRMYTSIYNFLCPQVVS